MRRVLVAVDATEASASVAEFVNEFFDGLDVEVLALHVGALPAAWYPVDVGHGGVFPWPYGPITRSGGSAEAVTEDARRKGEAAVERSGIESDEVVVAVGDPLGTIEATARDHDVDLIVVGRTHQGLLERLLSPSPARELAKDAPVPVLIVH